MSRRRRKKHVSGGGSTTVELNLMPFIDIFSLLTTFLLFSAVFVQIGILEVQIPFLSNAAPPKDKPERSIAVQVDVQEQKIVVETSWSAPPTDKQVFDYEHNDAGIKEMHAKLVSIRSANPETDLVTFFVDDEVSYSKMTKVLDAVKLLGPGDPALPPPKDKDNQVATAEDKIFLYKKVVMGSVML